MEEKEALKEKQLTSLEEGYKTTIDLQDGRIKMLNEEKRAAEKVQ